MDDWWLEGNDHECPKCECVCNCEVGSEFSVFECAHCDGESDGVLLAKVI